MSDLLKKILPDFWKKDIYYLLALELIFAFVILAGYFNFYLPLAEYADLNAGGNEFTLLADSFLGGRLDLAKYPASDLDCSVYGDKCYWALGPLPGMVLVLPVLLFKLVGLVFYQGYLNFFLLLAALYLCWRLARRQGYSETDSLWLAAAFCFASVAVNGFFNSLSWYFSHSFVLVLMLLAILEYFGRQRYWLIGTCFGLIFATRLTAGLAVSFFLFEIFFNSRISAREKIKNFFAVLLPVGLSLLLLAAYNFARFGNWLDTGYGVALVGSDYSRWLRQTYGLFNLHYFSNNFYYYFLKMPEAAVNQYYFLVSPYIKVTPIGLSFFAVSPLFISIFRADLKDKIVRYCYLATLPILAILLCYYNTGSYQFGPRYLLDLLPFWFLLLLFSFPKRQLAPKFYLLITISALANFLLYLILAGGFYY